jgi:hypothetical protein
VNSGIAAFLCSNLPSPPPDTDECPQSGVPGRRDRAQFGDGDDD